ncbi:hypothetical protein G6F24_014614 [Rhizopus arrhizus]|nr:hypothetical protein G6F24_014614 [Rhizopus arrhizus]
MRHSRRRRSHSVRRTTRLANQWAIPCSVPTAGCIANAHVCAGILDRLPDAPHTLRCIARNVVIGTPRSFAARVHLNSNNFELSNYSHWQPRRCMQIISSHRQRVARACNPVWSICWLRLPAGVAHSLWVASAGILSAHLWRAVRGGFVPAGVLQIFHRYCNHASSAALAVKQGGSFA